VLDHNETSHASLRRKSISYFPRTREIVYQMPVQNDSCLRAL